jgi:CHRD domain-containing protein
MKYSPFNFLAVVVVVGLLITPIMAKAETIRANPDGYQVVPTQNSPGTATFRAKVDRKAQTIEYTLAWQNLRGDIIQSHIHFGRRATNGDIVLFLCTNIGNTPATATPAPLCNGPREGTATGVLHAGDIVALAFGGITPQQQLLLTGTPPNEQLITFDELADAIDAGATYVVVHTKAQPSGELRGQIPDEGRASR